LPWAHWTHGRLTQALPPPRPPPQVGFRHGGFLRPGGALVMKVYEGAGTNEFIKSMQPYFTKVGWGGVGWGGVGWGGGSSGSPPWAP
jgi:hypothetical protein